MESRSLLSFLTVGIALVIALGSLPSCGGGGGGGGSGGGGNGSDAAQRGYQKFTLVYGGAPTKGEPRRSDGHTR